MYTIYTMPFNNAYNVYTNNTLDLNEYCIKNSSATYFMKVDRLDYSRKDFDEGDILIVDRSVQPHNNAWAVVVIDGNLFLKRIIFANGSMYLVSDNPQKAPLNVTKINDFELWGVVTNLVRKML